MPLMQMSDAERLVAHLCFLTIDSCTPRRVREIVPRSNLVEIDIEDPATGRLMADMFDIDEGCWGRANVNFDLHPEIDRGQSENVPHLNLGKDMIRGKNGTMRERSLPKY
jgi:hypothetical protein